MAANLRCGPLWFRLWLLILLALPAAIAEAKEANVTLYVFSAGTPVKDVEVLIDDELYTLTDARGVAVLVLPSGLHFLEMRQQDHVLLQQQILSHEDEISQWIVDITGGGSAIFDIESSAPETRPGEAAATGPDEIRAPGIISGHLVSADDGKPVAAARIYVSGVSTEIRSGPDGAFGAEVPAGTYTVSVLQSGFSALTRDGVMVEPESETTLELRLSPAGSELPEFVVVAPYITGSLVSVLAERRESGAVTDVLSAEQISRAGDSDAAGALKRVTGLTLVNGQYIYVRGLGERYSSVVLNDATIPSPDPTRRVVSLGLFPTDVIESVVVQKTASANLPAEFGGGTIQLRTVSFPPELTAKLSLSLGYRDGTTRKRGLDYKGSGADWIGIDDGSRDQPDSLASTIADGSYLRPRSFTNPDGLTPEELEVLGQDVAAKSTYEVKENSLPANLGLAGSLGNSFEFGKGHRWGFLTAFKYDNSRAILHEVRNVYSAISGGSGLQLRDTLDVDRTLTNIDTSAFGNLGVEFAQNQKIGFNAMLLRQTEDEAKVSEGIEDSQQLRRYQLRWIENELLSYQAVGSHTLPLKDWTLDWQYTDATATRKEPNTRTFRYDDDDEDGVYEISSRPDNNEQSWSNLKDKLKHFSAESRLPVEFGRNVFTLGAGLGNLKRNRDASIRSFALQGRIPNELKSLTYSDLFTDEYIGPGQLQLKETTRATDTYTASQTLDSSFVNLDLSLFDGMFRISTGMRREDNRQLVETSDLSNPEAPPVLGEIDQSDKLPSAALTWAFSPNAQIRAAYAKSVNRPDFREMSPAPYLDPLLDLITVGNPKLVTAKLKNYDLRWEYYFSPSESLSIAGFYKEFANPIEKTFSSGGSGRIITLQNALSAELKGVEVDYYQSLGWIKKFDWLNWLEDLKLGFIGPFDWDNYSIAFNYAEIKSSVDIDTSLTTQTNSSRPLQGQSPWVLNVQFGYHSPDSPTEWSLLYNEFGKRISQAGVQNQPDIYEKPFAQLDFVYKRRFADHWRLTAKVKNALDSVVKFSQGQETTRRFKPGREFSLELQWSY